MLCWWPFRCRRKIFCILLCPEGAATPQFYSEQYVFKSFPANSSTVYKVHDVKVSYGVIWLSCQMTASPTLSGRSELESASMSAGACLHISRPVAARAHSDCLPRTSSFLVTRSCTRWLLDFLWKLPSFTPVVVQVEAPCSQLRWCSQKNWTCTAAFSSGLP